MFNIFTFCILIVITLFHVYMGLGGSINKAAVLPKINGKDLPFHSAGALPVALLLGICCFAFAQSSGLLLTSYSEKIIRTYLFLSGLAFLFRGLFGLIGLFA